MIPGLPSRSLALRNTHGAGRPGNEAISSVAVVNTNRIHVEQCDGVCRRGGRACIAVTRRSGLTCDNDDISLERQVQGVRALAIS